MAGAPIPHPDLARRIRALEDRCLSLERERNSLQRIARIGRGRPVRLVETWEDLETEWPSPPASVFPIRFVDLSIAAWEQGNREIETTPRSESPQSLLAVHDKRYLLPRKLCLAVQAHDRRWWIADSLGIEYLVRLRSTLSKGGAASADILDWDADLDQWIMTGWQIDVYDKFLNAESGLAAKTKCQVRLDSGRYWVVNALCDADDTPDEDYEP